MSKQKLGISHSYLFLIIIFLLNVCYIFVYWQRSVTLLVGLAMFFFIVILIFSKTLRHQEDDILSELTKVIKKFNVSSKMVLLIFLIPIVFIPSPQIAFWKFNAIGKITITWLIFSVCWLNLFERSKDNTKAQISLSTPAVLFIVWSSILWICFSWDVGGYSLFKKAIATERIINSDRFSSIIFKIWEDYPISSHLGLGFLSYKDFENHAYSSHSQLYLISTYLFTKILQVIGGIKMVAATRLLPLLYSAFIAGTIIFVFLRTKFKISFNSFTTQLTLFLSIGFLLTLPDFWITLIRYNADNPFPLLLCFLLMMFTYIINNDYDAKGFKFLLYFVCLFSYMYGAFCLITLLFFMFRKDALIKFANSPQKLIKILCIGFGFALVSFLYPKIVIMALGYKDSASSFLFRSGLDGDMTYYSNIYQAVVNPYAKQLIRPWSSLLPALIFTNIVFFLGRLKSQEKYLGSIDNVIFLFSPYLFTIVFFPQATTIHPYLFDYILIFPLVFLGMCWSIGQTFQQKITGPKAYLFILFMSALVIYNLTKIAQAVRYL